MDLGEVDRLLDTRVILSYAGTESIADFTKRFKITFQSGLHLSGDGIVLSYFIPEEISSNREISMLLSQSESIREGNLYFLSSTLSTEHLHVAFQDLLFEEKTTVVDDLYLQDGKYYLSLRLHSSELSSFSNKLLKYTRAIPDFNISYMGPSPGMPVALARMKKFANLKNFEFKVEVPKEVRDSRLFSNLPNEWTSENRYLKSGSSHSELVVTNGVIQDAEKKGISVISRDRNLYSVEFGDLMQFMKLYFDSVYGSKIIRFWRTLHYKNGTLRFRIILPEPLSDAYLKILSRCSDSFPEWKPVITSINPV